MKIDEIEIGHDKDVADSMDFTKFHEAQEAICMENARWLATLKRESALIAMVRQLEAKNKILEHWFHGYKTPELSMATIQERITQLEADNRGLVEALDRIKNNRLCDTYGECDSIREGYSKLIGIATEALAKHGGTHE